MPPLLVQLYQRKRIININLNVIAAGLLAIACTKGVIWLCSLVIPHDKHWAFTTIALVCDIIFDVVIYYVLHWCANHWRPRRKVKPGQPKPTPFLKDATLVQFERALLAPIYYILAGALMLILQDLGWTPGWAMVGAFTSGLLATRFLHTAMGLYTGSFKDLAPVGMEGDAITAAKQVDEPPASPSNPPPEQPPGPATHGA